jgi:release factor glutamine methyltransferase
VTVLEIIQRSAEFLARRGVESPRLQIELMLAHVLEVPRLQLYLKFDRALTDPELDRLRGMVKRRGEREPLQHILGATSFCGLDFAVNREVLVPRPETELLAERAWGLAAQIAARGGAIPRVLDWGTGSGCLGIAIAVKCPTARVCALDASASALAVARRNAERHGVLDRVKFLWSDGFAGVPASERFDLVASNPPYIPSATIAQLEPEVRDYDPRAALDGGQEGLSCFERLADEAPPFLAEGGRLLLEFGDGQESALRRVLEARGWAIDAVERDYAQAPRILIASRKCP